MKKPISSVESILNNAQKKSDLLDKVFEAPHRELIASGLRIAVQQYRENVKNLEQALAENPSLGALKGLIEQFQRQAEETDALIDIIET